MRILAFDQATVKTGYAFSVDGQIQAYDTLKRPHARQLAVADMVLSSDQWMRRAMRAIIERYQPQYVALECVHLGENVSTLIKLAEFRGKCIAMIEQLGNMRLIDVSSIEVNEYLRLGVGAARAVKKQRAQFFATADVFGQVHAGGEGPLLPEDTADAVIILRIAETKARIGQLTVDYEAAGNVSGARRARGRSARMK